MTQKSFVTVLKTGLETLFLLMILFASGSCESAPGWIGATIREIEAVFGDSKIQWMVFSCLAAYLGFFFFLRFRLTARRSQGGGTAMPEFWLAGFFMVSTLLYAIHYSPSTPALILLAGAVIGQVAGFLENGGQKGDGTDGGSLAIPVILVAILGLASLWKADPHYAYEYKTHSRLTGPWDNPNIFGLLMGTGLILVGGILARKLSNMTNSGVRQSKAGKFAIISLCLVSAGLLGRGLLHSFSRGAWLASGCGGIYLLCFWLRSQAVAGGIIAGENGGNRRLGFLHHPGVLWFKRNWLTLGVVLFAGGVLLFWHFRQTDWSPARRALSVANPVDFSWRNRIAAWVGDLKIMAEQPWFGTGWDRSEPLYQNYYLPPKLTEGLAIQMNDYLVLGAMLGIPGLFCLGMYLWLTLRLKRTGAHPNGRVAEADWRRTVCHAGAIVLLVGFWFDGGLFKLPTAVIIWILLELGRGSLENQASRKI